MLVIFISLALQSILYLIFVQLCTVHWLNQGKEKLPRNIPSSLSTKRLWFIAPLIVDIDIDHECFILTNLFFFAPFSTQKNLCYDIKNTRMLLQKQQILVLIIITLCDCVLLYRTRLYGKNNKTKQNNPLIYETQTQIFFILL